MCVCVCVCVVAVHCRVIYVFINLVCGVCMGLFMWGLEICAHLVVGGVCVAEVCGGGFKVLRVVCVCDQVSA